MGNVASVISSKIIYIIGAVVITIAKPACEYIAKLVVGSTSTTTSSYFDAKADVIFDRLDKLSAIQLEHRAILSNVEKHIECLVSCLKAANSADDVVRQTLIELKQNIADIGDAVRATHAQNAGIEKKFYSFAFPLLEKYGRRESDLFDKINWAVKLIVQIDDSVEKLPNKIEDVANKYSTYLHNDYAEIYELLSKRYSNS